MKIKTGVDTDKGVVVGQGVSSARYTDHEIDQVRYLRSIGWSVRAIAEKMDMPRSVVGDVVAGVRSVANGYKEIDKKV